MSVRSRVPLLLLALALVVLFHRLILGDVLWWGLPALQFHPWRDYALDLLRSETLPLWSPYNGAGAPLFANYQSQLLYPPAWLSLFLPLDQTMSLTAVVHLFIAGWGMWAFGGRAGMTGLGRGVAALAFGLTSYTVARLGTYPIISAAVWLGWLLWAAHGVVVLFRRRDAAWFVLFSALLLLAGHAQTAWYTLLLVGLYALWLTVRGAGSATADAPLRVPSGGVGEAAGAGVLWRERGRRLAALAGLLALGAALSAPQLMATAELLATSQRAEGVDEAFALNFSYAPARAITLLAPLFYGTPADGSYLTEGAFFEDAAYVGLLPLLLALTALVAWVRRRSDVLRLHIPFWTFVGVVGFVMALGSFAPVFPFLFRHVPTFDLFQAPVRWHLWTVTALSVLAGYGAAGWGRGVATRAWARRALVACAGIVLVGVVAPRLFGQAAAIGVVMRGLLIPALVGIALCVLTLRQPPRDGRGQMGWAALVLTVVALDLVVANWALNPTAPAAFYAPRPDAASVVRGYWSAAREEQLKFDVYLPFNSYPQAEGQRANFRRSLLANLNLLDRRALLNNFDPLRVGHFDRYLALLEQAESPRPLLEAAGVGEVLPAGRVRLDGRRAWLVEQVCWHTSRESLEAALSAPDWNPYALAHMPGDAGCPEAAAPLASAPDALVIHDEGVRVSLDVNAPRAGWLILADVDYPGWSAAVDGAGVPIYRVNGAFRAVQVNAGAQQVVFAYQPAWLVPGVLLSAAALIALVLLFRLNEQGDHE